MCIRCVDRILSCLVVLRILYCHVSIDTGTYGWLFAFQRETAALACWNGQRHGPRVNLPHDHKAQCDKVQHLRKALV